MKKIKKLAAVLLTAVMVTALAVPGYAATTSSSDSGSVTINGLAEGVTASAYQIAKATYDESGNFLGYEMTVTAGSWSIGSDGTWTDPSEADLAALWAAIEAAGTGASGTASVSGGNDSATITGLPVGSYLIVITGSESVAYGMMIGSVSYEVDSNSGEWGVKDGSFVVEDCELWAKATTPTVEKTEHHGNGSDTHGESANAGDEITFDITINNIPSYEGDYPVFDVDDTLTGLAISQEQLDSLTVTIIDGEETIATLVKGTGYTVTQIAENEFDVNFIVDGKYTLNDYANKGYCIVIEYAATVVDSQEYTDGEAEHENDAVLTYSTTSYVNHDNGSNEGETEDTDYEYTFALRAEKTDGENALANATFGLFTDASCSNAYMQDDEAVTAVSDGEGTLFFQGLAEGTYYMKETNAPAGYLLNDAVYKVEISAEYNADGSIDTWSIVITLDGDEVASATQSADTGLTIINTRTGLLPSMGGRGTLLFTIIGCAIVAGAAVGVVTYRKRKAA